MDWTAPRLPMPLPMAHVRPVIVMQVPFGMGQGVPIARKGKPITGLHVWPSNALPTCISTRRQETRASTRVSVLQGLIMFPKPKVVLIVPHAKRLMGQDA